jgi:3-isopropylmalate/(R)-2-methylmalate dehydratase small subunit
VIASSFGGIFYRNAFNLGLPAIISADVNQIEQDHKVVIDFKTGKISNGSTGKSLNGDIIPENLLALVEAGGLVPYLDRKLNQK